MPVILKCRRTIVAILAILCLTALGLTKNMDVAMAIATVTGALSAANSYQRSRDGKQD